MRSPLAVALVTALVAIAAHGCGDAAVDAVVRADAGGVGTPGTGPDGASLPQGDAARPGFCEGAGPLVQLPQGSCTGDVGQRTFRFALCACTTAQVSGVLKTDSFHSLGAATKGNAGAVGANQQVAANARLTLGGSLWSSGQASADPAVALGASGSIATEIRAGGKLRIDGTPTCTRRAASRSSAAGSPPPASCTCRRARPPPASPRTAAWWWSR
jgi:hypothetical protein